MKTKLVFKHFSLFTQDNDNDLTDICVLCNLFLFVFLSLYKINNFVALLQNLSVMTCFCDIFV